MNRSSLITISLILLLSFSSFGLLTPAYSASRPFVHPDFIYSHQLRQKYRIPAQVNLNQASLAELKTLPGVDENIALKLLRLRKNNTLKSKQDLYQLPFMETREIQQLIQKISKQITF